MSLLSDLQTLSHGEFTRVYGAPLGYDKFLEYQVLAATRTPADPLTLGELVVSTSLTVGTTVVTEASATVINVAGTLDASALTAASLTISGNDIRFANGQTKIARGTGSPEGAVSGSPGDLYLRTDGGASTTLYVKTSGSATTTGWTAK